MSLVVREMQSNARAIQERLRHPINAVLDLGIDLKRKVIPIRNGDIPAEVLVTSLDVFGPKVPTLEDMAFGPIVHAAAARTIWVSDIQKVVCDKYHIPVNEVLSHRRAAEIVKARHIAMYLSRKLTTQSLPEIGRRFGGKDHTVIIHACRKIERLRNEDQQLDTQIIDLIDIITA